MSTAVKPSRRFQVLPCYAYCEAGDWQDSGTSRPAPVEAEAAAHAACRPGHRVRVATTQERIISVPSWPDQDLTQAPPL
jgi:hypothetical protein